MLRNILTFMNIKLHLRREIKGKYICRKYVYTYMSSVNNQRIICTC